MAVTMSDIAKHTGSSISSVSAALKGNRSTAKVSEKKRRQILEAAKQLGYRPSHAARTLKLGKTNVLGMVIGEIHTPYYGEMTSMLMEEAEKYGYSIQTYVTNWNCKRNIKAIDLLLGGRCDGILYYVGDMFHEHGHHYDYIKQNNIPIVVMTHQIKGLAYVGESWDPGFTETAEYLLEKGIRDVAFIGDRVTDTDRPKLHSLINIFTRYGLNLDLIECHNKPDEVYCFGFNFKKQETPYQIILTENDTLASALIKGLSDAGVKVPEEVGVIGNNDTRFSEYAIPALTTIGFNKKAFVKTAINQLLKMIDSSTLSTEKITFPTYLVKRDSV